MQLLVNNLFVLSIPSFFYNIIGCIQFSPRFDSNLFVKSLSGSCPDNGKRQQSCGFAEYTQNNSFAKSGVK